MDYNFLYNKRKDVPLLRGRIYMINLFTYPLFGSLIYTRQLDTLTKLSYGAFFIGSYFGVVASAMYHNNSCKTIDRSVYKRLDYAGIFCSNLVGCFPAFIHYVDTDLHLIILIGHLIINTYGIFVSLCMNFINTTKWYRVTLYWLSNILSFSCLYNFVINRMYLASSLYIFSYVAYLSGAIIYAKEKPNLVPGLFEFHELSHTLIVLGSLSIFGLNLCATGIL